MLFPLALIPYCLVSLSMDAVQEMVLRICWARDIRSTEKPNEKWLADVTKFKWYVGTEVHKVYLSAILDLCDRRIVSYVLSERNDNPLAFKITEINTPWVAEIQPPTVCLF